jgi:hypothetical protein
MAHIERADEVNELVMTFLFSRNGSHGVDRDEVPSS